MEPGKILIVEDETNIRRGLKATLLKPTQPAAIRETIASAPAASRRQREESQLFQALKTGLQRLDKLPAEPEPSIPKYIPNVGGLSYRLTSP